MNNETCGMHIVFDDRIYESKNRFENMYVENKYIILITIK